jgi:hypothetical protein
MADADMRREAAIKRLKANRALSVHAAIYAIVNVLLILIWAVSARSGFWPIWPILGWGVGLAIHGWIAYFQKSIGEDDIRREMERGG